jgi:hypothetical protein
MNLEAELFLNGRGANGRGEARLLLLRDTDGSVYFGAAEYAPDGFAGVAGIGADTGVVGQRTIPVGLPDDHTLLIDVPVGWSNEGGDPTTVTSYLPFTYALEHRDNPKGFEPGETKIEVYRPEGREPRTIDAWIRDATNDGDPQPDHQPEHVALSSGEPAVLLHFTHASGATTMLLVEMEQGVVKAPCWGDQTPCESILRTIRLR